MPTIENTQPPARPPFGKRARALVSRRTLTGASASLIGTTVATNVLRIVNTMILTRLLTPSDYGLVAIILSAFFVISMLTDTGCQAFVVRHEKGEDTEFLDVVWTIHLIRGVTNALLAVAIAIPLANLLGKYALAPLLSVAATSLAIDGASSLTTLTALRRGLIRRLSLIDFTAFLIQLTVGLVAAWFLRDAWAIVIAMVSQSIARTTLSYLLFKNSHHRIRLNRHIGMELWRFSRVIVMSSTITLVISQFDRLILARVYSLPEFGVYSIAGSLAAAPTAIVALYASRIMFPALAKSWRENPEEIASRFYKLRGTVFYSYMFCAGGLIGFAPLLITLLYDRRYLGAIPFLQLLAITTALVMLTRPINELLTAIGKIGITFEANVARLVWLAIGSAIGYFAVGPMGVVVALALIEVPAYLYSVIRMRALGFHSLRHDLAAFTVIIVGAIVGMIASSVVSAFVSVVASVS